MTSNMDATDTGTSSTSFWIQFFKDAGIPAGVAASYAVAFTDNRIKVDMLPDLNTELLAYMNVTVVGDVIAVLKHAKIVHADKVKERALSSFLTIKPKPTASSPRQVTALPAKVGRSVKPSNRMVEHYLSNETAASPAQVNHVSSPAMSTDLAARLGPGGAPTRVARTSTPARSSAAAVATRLGPTPVSKKVVAKDLKTSVFNRLGGMAKTSKEHASDDSVFTAKSAPTITRMISTHPRTYSSDSSSSVLQYAGILKGQGEVAKKRKLSPVTVESKRPKPSYSQQTTHAKKPLQQRLGVRVKAKEPMKKSRSLLSMDTELQKKSARLRIGGAAVITAATTTTTASRPVVATRAMRSASTAVSSSVKSRLGLQRSEVTSSVDVVTPPSLQSKRRLGGVFQRLGAAPNSS